MNIFPKVPARQLSYTLSRRLLGSTASTRGSLLYQNDNSFPGDVWERTVSKLCCAKGNRKQSFRKVPLLAEPGLSQVAWFEGVFMCDFEVVSNGL